MVDVEPSARDAGKAAVVLRGDAAAVAEQLRGALSGLDSSQFQPWLHQLASKVRKLDSSFAHCARSKKAD